jgi:hypothetical protein
MYRRLAGAFLNCPKSCHPERSEGLQFAFPISNSNAAAL